MLPVAGIPHEAPQERCHQIFDHPEDVLIFSPDDIAEVRAERMRLMTDAEELLLMLGQLRPEALSRQAGISPPGRPQASTQGGQGWAASALAAAMSEGSADDSPSNKGSGAWRREGTSGRRMLPQWAPGPKCERYRPKLTTSIRVANLRKQGRIKLLCESSFYAFRERANQAFMRRLPGSDAEDKAAT